MKKTLTISCCVILVIFFTGFTVYNITNQSDQVDIQDALSNLSSEEIIITEKNKFSNEAEIQNSVSSISESSIVEETKSKTITIDPTISAEKSKMKSLNLNGNLYEATFKETTDSINSGKNKRKTNIYYNGDNSVYFECDATTEELLVARFEVINESQTKITEEQARKIAESFLKKQCDIFSEYTFDKTFVNDSEYIVAYSKHFSGYESIQTLRVYVTFSGEIKMYSHKRFIFDGYDLNVKIDGEKLDKQLYDNLKKAFGESVEYSIEHKCVGIDEKGNLSMDYKVNILTDEYSTIYGFYIPITQNIVQIK